MICKDGKISLYGFTLSASLFVFLICNDLTFNFLFKSKFETLKYVVPLIYGIGINLLLKSIYKDDQFQIAIRASILGSIFAAGLYVYLFTAQNVQLFGLYMAVMSLFHYSEFLTIAIIQPNIVSTDSFVINHSPQYVIAAIMSWVEFGAESYFFPGWKVENWASKVGLVMCIAGEVLRKTAMLTARRNFNHLVQREKADDHVLVKHGIYNWFRHPSYVGWFYWSLGTQLLLLNPICIVGYTVVSWFFFKERITYEEITLLNFFGKEYCEYQQKVGTGLPFIEGYRIKM